MTFCHMLLSCSLFVHTVVPRTLNDRCTRCLGSLAVIQQWAHEEFANNQFKSLFICRGITHQYNYNVIYIYSQFSSCIRINSFNAGFRTFTVHDTENLTFSADDRTDNPHIAARTISGFRADT